ncbi:LCP family protein [Clostridium vincentii]|uniref:Putative transcriptional regulator YwtF n=1 Tax=Clostridium vincentii TaxID=52704 RepID=A0A2T0BER8_9CLOT|nr:LCP family protein [Clostridium vincentii]PRR82391.1 putative transcriptional regulator YwtF [Clostridium vincentii]
MGTDRREPEAIRRKRKRRAPRSLEDIERSRHVKFKDVPEGKKQKVSLKNKRKKNKSIVKKIVLGISICITIMILSAILSLIGFFFKINNENTIKATAPAGDSVNILVLGMDIGDVNQAENNDIKRTDTMMMINYNKESKSAQVISIPRDTLVNDNSGTYKINAAYQNGGDQKVKTVVENMLSVTVNYIVKIDYAAFRGFIDAIGGIEVDIKRNMIYDDDAQDLHINFKEGTTVQLDGQKAEEYFRWRKNNDGSGLANGDLDRINNQHEFLQKIVDKCKSPSIIFKLSKILNSVAENMDTNMSSFNMINYGLKFVTLKDKLEMKTIQGDPKTISGQSYLVFNKNSNKELLQSLQSGAVATTSSKSESRILILNGTKIISQAAQAKTALEVFGWSKIDTGNADPHEKSVIQTDDKDIKKILASQISEITKFEGKPTDSEYNDYDVVIIIGNDYKKLGE